MIIVVPLLTSFIIFKFIDDNYKIKVFGGLLEINPFTIMRQCTHD